MGTEAFWVPAVLAAVGTGVQQVNQHQAQNREANAEVQSIQDQEAIQRKAAGQASELTRQIAKNTPDQVQGKATGDYVAQLRKNAAGASALAPAVGASSRYNAGTTASQAAVSDYGNEKASEMGAIDAAVRQRQNEGLGMQTLGTNLNTLGAQSYGTNFVDQLRAQVAGQANPWVSLAAGLMTNAGRNYTSAGPKTVKPLPGFGGVGAGMGTVPDNSLGALA